MWKIRCILHVGSNLNTFVRQTLGSPDYRLRLRDRTHTSKESLFIIITMSLTTTLQKLGLSSLNKNQNRLQELKYFNFSVVTMEPNLLCKLCLYRGRLVQNNSDSTNIQEIEVAFPSFLCSGDVLKSKMMTSDLCDLILHFQNYKMMLEIHFNLCKLQPLT